MEEVVPIYLGRVTYIIDLDYFYMHIGTAEQLEEFSSLEESIAKFCTPSCIDGIDNITEGQLVLVDCQESYGCWRRGQITRIGRDSYSADVFYIDYGETENIEGDRICSSLKPEFMTFPSQALRCCLAGIRPISKKWTTRATKIFEQHTQIKIFNTVILTTDNAIFKVALYRREGNQRCLSVVLIDEELGFPVEDEVTEFFEDAEKFYSAQFKKKTPECIMDYSSCYSDSADVCAANSDIIYNAAHYEGTDVRLSPVGIINNNQMSSSESTDIQESESQKSIPSSSLLSKVTAAIQSSKNNTFNNDSTLSPEIIPQFNFDSLHRTQKTTSDRLMEEKHKQMQESLQIEIERVKTETKEQSELAVAAGYGGMEDDTSNLTSPVTPQIEKEDWDKELRENTITSLKENPLPEEEIGTPNGRELLEFLNQIFVDSEREPVDKIRERVRSLLGTDASCFDLNRDEMCDLLNTVLNRAVRHHEVLSDVMLEVLEILCETKYFTECLLKSMKKVQDKYIKVQHIGNTFSLQCSQILGHIYNKSYDWRNSESIQQYVESLLEKWLMFDKKAQQMGSNRLQEIYLDSFTALWEIIQDMLLDKNKNLQPRLLKECEDKILNTDVPQNIRSRTLHIYVMLNMGQSHKDMKKQKTQTHIFTIDVACQTECKESGVSSVDDEARYSNTNSSSGRYDKSNSASPALIFSHDETYKLGSRDSQPGVMKTYAKVLESGRIHSPLMNDTRESPVYSVECCYPEESLLLLTPASFSDSIHSNENSSQNSSLYYSFNENMNSSALTKDLTKCDSTSQECKTSQLGDNTARHEREKSPLVDLIETDAHTNFYKIDENDKQIKKEMVKPDVNAVGLSHTSFKSDSTRDSPSFGKQFEEHDWWDIDKNDVKQKKVKDHWYVSESDDTQESASVKSEKSSDLQVKSLNDVSSWMLKSKSKCNNSTVSKHQIEAPGYNKKVTTLNKKENRKKQNDSITDSTVRNVSSKRNLPEHECENIDSSPSSSSKVERKKPIDWWDRNESDSSDDADSFDDEDKFSDDDFSKSEELSCESSVSKTNPENMESTQQQEIKPKPSWKPLGGRKCTSCGDSTHLIYDCPDKHKRGFFY